MRLSAPRAVLLSAAMLIAGPAFAQQTMQPGAQTPPGATPPSGSAATGDTAQVAPTPMAEPGTGSLTPELTEAEQKTLAKCMKMNPVQQAQSSKCSKVIVKSGKSDPAKSRGPDSSTNPPA